MSKKRKGLGPFNRAVWERIKDIDYIEQLSEEERQWYRKFLLEYYQHRFDEDPIDTRDEAYKESCDRENRLRRDIMTVKPQVPTSVEECIDRQVKKKGKAS